MGRFCFIPKFHAQRSLRAFLFAFRRSYLAVAASFGRSSHDDAEDRSLRRLLAGISQPLGSGCLAGRDDEVLGAGAGLPQLDGAALALGAGLSQLDGAERALGAGLSQLDGIGAGFEAVGRLGQPDERAWLEFLGHLFAGFSSRRLSSSDVLDRFCDGDRRGESFRSYDQSWINC